MTSLMDIFVTVKPDMDKFGPEVKKKLERIDTASEGKKVAGRFGVGFNGAFGGIVKHSAGLFVGAFAVIKGAQVFGSFINDARESAKVARVSAQVIKSTGGVAGITAVQMGNLATAISNKTGADDEAIQSGENLLATFTNVKNGIGKGNDVFNRATQAAVDMASAMNNGVVDANGLKAANIQLGKALNDPVKGVTALSKVGVSFTQSQKDQIKTLVESGNTLKAQKIILGEVGKEFGGAAAAAADPLSRLKTIIGNVSESVGGILLPIVDKFANFLGDTVVPGIYALGSAFQGEGVTSNGFVGFMERIGVVARSAFGVFKTEVLPRLKDFGGVLRDEVLPRLQDFAGFVVDKVVPAVAKIAKNLVTSFAPAVKDIFGFFKTEVLPRLKDFAQWVGDKIVPKVTELATGLSKNKDFLVPFAATILALVVGLKAWAIIQAVLNAELFANPIGLVVLAIAALVAGIIWAFKNVGWFHDALVGAFNGIKKAAQLFAPLVKAAIDVVVAVFKLWWQYYAKPILTEFWKLLKFAWEKAQAFARVVGAAFDAIKEPARVAIKYVIDTFLGMVETVLTGAAKAFGWVPNLGDKLKAAAKAFGTFRDQVNSKLDGIHDQTIKITPIVLAAQQNRRNNNAGRTDRAGVTYATGGGVFGSGTGTSDSIPAMLSNGEHVWTAREVSAAGGHRAMESMRKAVVGFAAGGAVGVNVKSSFPPLEGPINGIARVAVAVAKPIAQTLADQLISANGPAGPPGSVRSFRGEKLNARTIGMLLSAEKILGHVFNIMQGSYSTRVAASGGTHAGGGVMDTDGPGGWNSAVSALRRVGFAAWHRTPAQGPWGHHIHSVAIGDPTESGAAKRQVQSYLHGGDGLGMAKGGAVKVFDKGGAWKSGTLGVNTSGTTETVVPGNGEVELGSETLRSMEKAFTNALKQGTFRLTQTGGGVYVLQMSNG